VIDVEAYIVFLAACFFMILWFLSKANKKSNAFMGIFSAVSWITLGFLWLFLAYEPSASGTSYSTYAVAFLFNGVGIMMIVLVVIDLFNIGGKSKRELSEDVETE
jgi:Ni,Fe-hydrogenase I cytochrome b subunit